MEAGTFATRGARLTLAATTATVLLAVAACSVGTPAATHLHTTRTSPRATSTTSPTTTSPAEKAKRAALSAYRGMWQDFAAAGTTSDWQSSSLGQHATGIALNKMSRSLYADHVNGLVTKGKPILNPHVSSVDSLGKPRKIIVTDCGDSTHWLKYHAENGKPADSKPGGRQLINAVVEKQADGSWKVSDYGVHGVGTC